MTLVNSVQQEDKRQTTIELGISITIDNDLEDSEMHSIAQSAIDSILKVRGVKGVGYSDIEVRTVNVDKRKLDYDESWG